MKKARYIRASITRGQPEPCLQMLPGLVRCAWPSSLQFSDWQLTVPSLCMQALVTTPLSFLRTGGLLRYGFLSSLAASPRAQRRIWQDNTAFFGQDVRLCLRPLQAVPPSALHLSRAATAVASARHSCRWLLCNRLATACCSALPSV